MAEFALWATAAEPAFPPNGRTFAESYRANRTMGGEVALESSPVGPHLLAFVKRVHLFEDRASVLLESLTKGLEEPQRPPKGWPANARGLAGELKRLAPPLRGAGVKVGYEARKSGGGGKWRLEWLRTDPGRERGKTEGRQDRQDRHTGKRAGQTGSEPGRSDAGNAGPEAEPAGEKRPPTSDDAGPAGSAGSTPPQSRCAVCGGLGNLHPHSDGALLHLMCVDRYLGDDDVTLPF